MDKNKILELDNSIKKLIKSGAFGIIKNIEDDSELAKSINSCLICINHEIERWENILEEMTKEVNLKWKN